MSDKISTQTVTTGRVKLIYSPEIDDVLKRMIEVYKQQSQDDPEPFIVEDKNAPTN